MTSQYAWRFPDGETIPVSDGFAIATKLRAMDRFRERLSRDLLDTGYWYDERYDDEIERIIEDAVYDPDKYYIEFGFDVVPGRGGASPRFRLPDGRTVGERGLVEWLIDEGYTFQEWLRYNRYGDEFRDQMNEEIERLLHYDDPDMLIHYGIKRVPMGSPSKKGGSNPKPKAPAKKAPARRSSASKSVKAGTGKGGARTSKPRGKGARR